MTVDQAQRRPFSAGEGGTVTPPVIRLYVNDPLGKR